jgi:NADH:ubiquinone oxidoreductase subunit 6 (subunit J)
MAPIIERIPLFVFGLLSVILIGLSLIVVTSRSVFRGAIALTGALGMVAGLFALLGADFVAASQLLIYVGGIMIIMLFVIMLSQQPANEIDRQSNEQWIMAGLFALAVACGLFVQFRAAYSGVLSTTVPTPTTASIGRMLLGEMLVPFEAVSLVLLAALVGAVYFGQDKEKS